jgi:hypothetical protein
VRDTADGLFINRQVLVTEIPIASGDSDPGVLIKAFAMLPVRNTSYPEPGYESVVLIERNLQGIDRFKQTVDVDLVYRGNSV